MLVAFLEVIRRRLQQFLGSSQHLQVVDSEALTSLTYVKSQIQQLRHQKHQWLKLQV